MSKQKAIPEEASQPEATPTYVVGIGASAGGVEALTRFFEQVPADSGMAYVVILHLSPDYDSQLAQLLQEVASIPVSQVTETVRVEPNHVYVVPPDKQLQMDEGNIVVRSNARLEERRAPVDIFLRTLAESHGPLAIAVILSGTGANGSMGLKRVKEKGGAVFVQNPREAAFNEMPRHAIATDLVDDILPVAHIPGRLLAYRRGLGTVSIPEDAPQRPEDQQQALREVFTQLRVRTGHDFSNYKRSTLLRRLERRISIHNLASLPAYAAFLREHTDETHALLKDLLISVTNFFRDKPAFQYLEQQVMPALARREKETLRIWVTGCATGEEAYSLAMLCAEQTMGSIDAPKVQIFATDIDEDAIATAREGLYTLNDAADVSADRLSRFFIKEGDAYRVRREIREMILFASQNVLKDPPFSKLDLVTCRNLLIYLNPIAQERVMETFHFALNPGGYLLLGMSETVDGSGDLYATVSREYHLYQSRHVASRPYPVPESIPPLPLPRKRPVESDLNLDTRPTTRPNFGDLHQQMLEQYAPPSIIVNEEYDILHFTPRAGRYLHFAGGELSKNLLKLIRPELRLELRTGLYQATHQQSNVEIRNLRISLDETTERGPTERGPTETLTLHIRPVLGDGNPGHDNSARGFILVLLEPVGDGTSDSMPVLTPVEPVARQLESELIRVKAQLRSANEHHELQAEELKASNEELQAMNEELRSAAEELETSKEELQSINEELTTVNQELKVKVEESSLVSNNLQNLINSTDIATLFLDRSLRVNLFTPATREIFNLIQSDFGRPLSDITNRLTNPHLQADAEAVLSKLQPIERGVTTTDGRAFIMRVLPYRTAEDRINGVVLTFVDITDRKLAEEALHQSEEQLSAIVGQATAGIARTNIDGTLTFVNQRYHELLGYGMAEVLGTTMQQYTHPDDLALNLVLFQRLGETGEPFEVEKRYIRKNGSVVWVHNSVSALYDSKGAITQLLAVSIDITARRQAETALRETEQRLRLIADTAPVLIWETDEHGISFVNDHYLTFFGTRYEEIQCMGWATFLHPDDAEAYLAAYRTAFDRREAYAYECRFRGADGEYRWLRNIGQPSVANRFVGCSIDITERKQLEQQKEFLFKLSDALRPLADPALIQQTAMDMVGRQLGVHRAFYGDMLADEDTLLIGPGYADRLSPLEGYITLSEFDSTMADYYRQGQTLVINDIATTDAIHSETTRAAMTAIRVIASVGVPLLKSGRVKGILSIHHAQPRNWTPTEITLIEETAERTWAAVERAKAEVSLRETEHRLASIRPLTLLGQTEELAKIGSWSYHPSTGEFTWSAGMYRLFGLTPDQTVQPEIYLDFVVDDDRQQAQALVAYLHEGTGHVEMSLRIQVGELIKTLRIKADVIGDGNQQQVMGVDLDISEQLQAQRQLLETADNLQAVLDSSPAAVALLKAVHDPQQPAHILEFRLAVGNNKLAQFLRQPLAHIIGQPAEHFSELLWDEATMDVLRHIYQSHEARYDEKPMPTPNQDHWLALSATRQDDGVVLTGLDITALKQIQSQQGDWLTELEASRHSVDALTILRASLNQRTELLRAVSHDLRGNFGVINSALSLLEMADSEGERAQMMEMVLRNVRQATGLLTDLLDLARLETGQQQRVVASCDSGLLLTELGRSLQPMADEHALTLSLVGPATLVVENDRQLVYRMAQNLIMNALKYTHQGNITVDWGARDDRWWFTIVDTGPGLNPELVARLNANEYTPMTALPPDTSLNSADLTIQRGEGIGLRIVRELAHLLDARLQVSSEAGVGTHFLVSLPLRYD